MDRGIEIKLKSRTRLRQFLSAAIKEPLSIGAIAPSSPYLAKHMVTGIGPGSRVVELGAGTGIVTQAILAAGVEPKDLVALEQNGEFTDLLKERFPNVVVAKANALELQDHINTLAGPPDFVISGLPLMLFTAKQKSRLISRSFESLGPNGFFHQFTYGGKCPVERSILDPIGLKATFLKLALLNLPPAFIYRLERR
jgi:phosphatidylethanolamine/phosphatidyl-N-methylethanolamine N-methyltransferase